VCNALLVQRSSTDALRGRALTFVISATYGVMGASTVVAGAIVGTSGARWTWAGGAALIGIAALVGYALARGVAPFEEPAEA